VRISGPEAIAIASGLFVSARGRDLTAERQRRVYYGEIRDDGAAVDEVLVHVMRAPHSYTREDVVEINGHGGPGPLNAILELTLKRGARLARPGEFTYRAFMNGRIDLVQAEAVIDRIRARTRASLRSAGAAASGALSRRIVALQGVLAGALARIEAAVDFPEEDLPELVDDGLRAEIQDALSGIQELLRTADAGRMLREGAAVAIAGRPNVGKSSLFNALLRENRAIVTGQPGTTRDLIEETITIKGVPVRLVDTAGLREAEEEAEQLGVAAARMALERADAVVLVIDASVAPAEEEKQLATELSALETPLVLVMNKSDLAPTAEVPGWDVTFQSVCRLSALTGQGLNEFEQTLGTLLLGDASIVPDECLVTRLHQKDSLRRAGEALERLLEQFDASPEFLSIDLREALTALGELTGETTPDDVLEQIFASFCIGK
jgi:tRNA modification GTPase